MGWAAKVHRGFHRIGIALAGGFVVVGILATFVYPSNPVSYADFAMQFVYAAIAYGVCRLIGWIIAGFVGE